MTTTTGRGSSGQQAVRLIHHESFLLADAERIYGPGSDVADAENRAGYMPDELTRDCCRRMHYAAFRMHGATNSRVRSRWKRRYFALRDRVVLGNHKLIFRAVSKRNSEHHTDDLIGECYLVLIRAVAAYNPWFGVRFSTYAFTCLLRALSRLGRRLQTLDALHRSLSAEMTSSIEDRSIPEPDETDWTRIHSYLRRESSLLTPREKTVLKRRYAARNAIPTLSELGEEMGISKERVRQIELSAVGKLRQALLDPAHC